MQRWLLSNVYLSTFKADTDKSAEYATDYVYGSPRECHNKITQLSQALRGREKLDPNRNPFE